MKSTAIGVMRVYERILYIAFPKPPTHKHVFIHYAGVMEKAFPHHKFKHQTFTESLTRASWCCQCRGDVAPKYFAARHG
jgi:hypothetical protein